jgi:large subunit ribosomal protein L15
MKLPKVVQNRKKRVGRGMGSGKGSHTSGRGQKGQRGKGKFHPKGKPVTVNISKLESLPSGSKITVELLVKEKLVDAKLAKAYGVKILGGGKTTKKFIFMIPTSKSVAKLGEKKEKVEEKPVKISK